jgi:hypothetical protein
VDAASCICERNTEKYEGKKMCGTWTREKGKKIIADEPNQEMDRGESGVCV